MLENAKLENAISGKALPGKALPEKTLLGQNRSLAVVPNQAVLRKAAKRFRVGVCALGVLCAGALMVPAQAAHEAHTQPHTQVAILMFDGVQIIDFAGPYEVFGQAGMGVYTVSPDGEAVTTAMGLKTVPDFGFGNAPEFDVLLVPGGDIHDASHDERVQQFIQRHLAQVDQVLSVCTGSFILAEAGVLDGKQATTFHRALPGFTRDYPAIDVVKDVRWVDNGKVVTSAGLSSGIDAALHLVSEIYGEEKARSTALHLEYDWQPDDGFVRTLMADRYLPDLNIDWPASTRLRVSSAVGDKNHWRQRLHVNSELAPARVIQLIADALDQQTEWQRAAAPAELMVANDDGGAGRYWRDEQEGKQLALSVHPDGEPQSGAYGLLVELTVMP